MNSRTGEENILNFLDLPDEVITENIAPYFSYSSLRALRCTNPFFSKNVRLKKIQEEIPMQFFSKGLRTFILHRGKLWGTGWNNSAQLGLGHTENINKFTPINHEEFDAHGGVEKIIMGDWHAFVICYDNTVWGCGNNS